MKNRLDHYISFIQTAFRNSTYRTAHAVISEKMIEMAKDNEVLFEIIRQNLLEPGFFKKKRTNPVVALNIFRNRDFSIVAHCWVPLPSRATNVSHQSVHHHGRLLLTSVAPLGEGYESVIFKNGFTFDKDSEIAHMKIDKVYKNPLNNIEFIDSYTPHVVFYPNDFSITYALWSYDKNDGFISALRRLRIVQANKRFLLASVRRLGISKFTRVNQIEFFDFYPDCGELRGMRERVMYPVGSQENFIHNVFYILYKTGFNDKGFLEKLNSSLCLEDRNSIERPLSRFLNGEVIKDRFDPVHLDINKINFSREELLRCFQVA